jgi:hypothetical protein
MVKTTSINPISKIKIRKFRIAPVILKKSFFSFFTKLMIVKTKPARQENCVAVIIHFEITGKLSLAFIVEGVRLNK